MTFRVLALGCALACLTVPAMAQAPGMPRQPTAAETAALAAQGARPGDDAMTCQQIGMEMAPYAQALMPSVAALGETARESQAFADRQRAQAAGQAGMGMAAGVAGMLPGGGVAAQAAMAAQYAQIQRQMAEAKPLKEKQMAQSADLANQLAPMQAEPRFNRLMQLAEAKKCSG